MTCVIPPPTTRLVALDGRADVSVGLRLTVIGRDPICDLRLDSVRVSRLHCCLAVVDGEVLVRDLGSTNGTRINGHLVECGRLNPGDELSVGDLRFRLETSPEPPES